MRIVRWIIVAGLCFAAPASAQDAPGAKEKAAAWMADLTATTRAALERARAEAEALRARAAAQASRVEPVIGVRMFDPLAARGGGGPQWSELGPGDAAPGRVVLLVHGLDEPGDIWDDLAPALAQAGFTVARFDYPNDQHVAPSAELLTDWMRRLRSAGAVRVDLVCHSMGGLVARDALTRAGLYGGVLDQNEKLPRVERLILLGTPGGGSPWAGMEAVAEAREGIVRFADDPGHDLGHLLGLFREGRGGAAQDLAPGSAFLKDLDSRGWPAGLAVTAVVGRIVPRTTGLQEELGAKLGDGVVPEGSATPAGVADVVLVEANHRGMVRYGTTERAAREMTGQTTLTPPAVPIVLERLSAGK